MDSGWRRWTYRHWNLRLVEHCLGHTEGRSDEPVERIPATPEELLEVAGDHAANPKEVVEAFVKRVEAQLPKDHVSFSTFCRQYQGWSPRSDWPPPFFAMLWLTCLVAYGYPDSTSGFHGRMSRLFGRQQHVGCLPELWYDVARWTNKIREKPGGASRHRRLQLPPDDHFRSIIGHSWFLAFPHQQDRRKLRKLLEQADLVGEEPPVRPVVALLERNEREFGKYFREDLSVFVEDFFRKGADVRRSPFWRAVRQEALPPRLHSPSLRSSSDVGLVAVMEDDELIVFVACSDDATLPSGFTSRDFGVDIDGFSNYVLAEDVEDSELAAMDRATLQAFQGQVGTAKIVSQARRGVLVFQKDFNEYRLVGGSEADQAEIALVRNDKVASFRRAYGGKARPSRLKGWQQVVEAKVRIRPEAPPGLEGVRHLQETMIPPSVLLAGGIRTGDGFYAFPKFLPVVRFRDAQQVEVLDAGDEVVGRAERSAARSDEWRLPEELVERAPGKWTVRARWISKTGDARTSDTKLTLVDRKVAHSYKRFGAGHYAFESCAPGEETVVGGEEIPLGITAAEVSDELTLAPPRIEVDPAPMDVSDNPSHWTGLEPDDLVGHVADALGALSVRRSGVRYHVLLDLLSSGLGIEVRDAPVLFYNLVRGWAEAGTMDVSQKQGRKEQYVLARRPGFVAYRREAGVRASLLGLVPSALEERARSVAERRGIVRDSLLPPCKWLPKVMQVECETPSVLREVSDDLGLAPPRWLRWPEGSKAEGGLDVRPSSQGLHVDAPPDSFVTEARWDWYLGRFVKERRPRLGIRVERRTHPERSSLYVVVVDGEDRQWSYSRNWALLFAYALDEESPIFSLRTRRPILRSERADVYLPLPVGRLCATLGSGLAGPVLGSDETRVEEYRYPLGLDYQRALTGWISDIGCLDFGEQADDEREDDEQEDDEQEDERGEQDAGSDR